jgi:hypothetical protein
LLREPLVKVLRDLAKKEKADTLKSIEWLTDVLSKGQALPLLGNTEIRILTDALNEIPASTILQVKVPQEKGSVNREELKTRLNQWLDDLPNEPVLLNLVSE